MIRLRMPLYFDDDRIKQLAGEEAVRVIREHYATRLHQALLDEAGRRAVLARKTRNIFRDK